MKIEKINDSQIRCTLTSADLASREIKLSELAYGTEKAKNLFQDMMRQAHYECGFESDNSPLMIEAIPVAPDSIVLIITKVDDPEELDTRFSKFSAAGDETEGSEVPQFTGADNILELFQKIYEAKKAQAAGQKKKRRKQSEPKPGKEPESTPVNLVQSFRFQSLDDAILAARGLNRFLLRKKTLCIKMNILAPISSCFISPDVRRKVLTKSATSCRSTEPMKRFPLPEKPICWNTAALF